MTGSNGKKGAAQAAPTLPELEDLIRAEDQAMEADDDTAHKHALEHALQMGQFLILAKPQVPHGGWYKWLKKILPKRHPHTAALWMNLAAPANHVRTRDCSSIEEAIRVVRGPRKPRKGSTAKKATTAGRRLRSLYPQRRASDNELIQARINILKFVQVLEIIDLPGLGVGEAEQITLADILEELAIAGAWVDGSATVVAAHMGELEIRERIRQLREDTNGRSSFEIETALKIADRLEKKLKPALGAA